MHFSADCTLAPTSQPTCAPAESPRIVPCRVFSIDDMADCSIVLFEYCE